MDIFDILGKDIKESMVAGNYLLVLISILTIPDICASIDSGNGETTEQTYKKWLDEYTCYKANSRLFNNLIVYKQRCKLLHNGRFLNSEIDQKLVDFDVYFSLPSNIKITSTNASVPITVNNKKFLQVDLEDFVGNILQGFNLWKKKVSNTKEYSDYMNDAVKYGPPDLGSGFNSNLPSFQ